MKLISADSLAAIGQEIGAFSCQEERFPAGSSPGSQHLLADPLASRRIRKNDVLLRDGLDDRPMSQVPTGGKTHDHGPVATVLQEFSDFVQKRSDLNPVSS